MLVVHNADETGRNSALTRKLRPIRRIDSAPDSRAGSEKDMQLHCTTEWFLMALTWLMNIELISLTFLFTKTSWRGNLQLNGLNLDERPPQELRKNQCRKYSKLLSLLFVRMFTLGQNRTASKSYYLTYMTSWQHRKTLHISNCSALYPKKTGNFNIASFK